MAIDPQIVKYGGPYMGVSCLPWKLGPQGGKAALSVNADTFQGVIKSRPGYRVLWQFDSQQSRVLGIHGFRDRNGESLLLVVRWIQNSAISLSKTTWALIGSVHRMDGKSISAWNWSAHPFGVAPDPDNTPTFATSGEDVYIAFKNGRIHRLNMHENGGVPEPVDATPPVNSTSQYATNSPRARIIDFHHGRMWMAGFSGSSTIGTSASFPEDQDVLQETSISSQIRNEFNPPSHMVMVSDGGFAYEKINCGSAGSIFGVPSLGQIRAFARTEGVMLILTEDGVFAVDGRYSPFSVNTVTQGVGCVGQRSVVHGPGIVAWMAPDGFYAYMQGQVRKISDDIQDMFVIGGGWRHPPPRRFGDKASDLGYPFQATHSLLDHACGVYDKVRGCFMWSFTTMQTKPPSAYDIGTGDNFAREQRMNSVTVAWFPATDSWNVYAPSGDSTFYPTDWTSVFDGARHRTFFCNDDGQICAWAEDCTDKKLIQQDVGGGTMRPLVPTNNIATAHDQLAANVEPIRWMWVSPQIEPMANTVFSVRSLRVRQRAAGDLDTMAALPSIAIEGERSFDESGVSLSVNSSMEGSPRMGAPEYSSTIPSHYWGSGVWYQAGDEDNFTWSSPDTWKARYSIPGTFTSHAVRIGIYQGLSDCGLVEVHGLELEIQPKRDIT